MGVDGGGTKTEAVVVDAARGTVLGIGVSGPSNYHNVGIEAAARHILEASHRALREAGIRPPVDAAAIALAGLDTRFDKEYASRMLRGLGLAEKTIIEHDAHAALMAGSFGGYGVAVIAGTGSIAYAYGPRGRFIAGNHGWILGDQGSGFWIGLTALRETARILDGRSGEASALPEAILSRYGAADLEELSYKIYMRGFSVDDIAGLAPIVLELAEKGDEAARAIAEKGAEELARAVAAAAGNAGLENPRIYYTGGLFRNKYYSSLFAEKAGAVGEPARLRYRPVVGSIAIAAQETGLSVNWENLLRDKRLLQD